MARAWIAVLRTADAAARWHVHQRRKGAAEEPYVNHLLEAATNAHGPNGAPIQLCPIRFPFWVDMRGIFAGSLPFWSACQGADSDEMLLAVAR